MNLSLHELAALGAAMCWATTGIIVSAPLRAMGAQRFTRVRGWLVCAVLVLIVLASGRTQGADAASVATLALSGLIGIMLGDTANYAAVNRLGPRRAGAIFALNAPMAALLGWLFLGETLAPRAVAGIAVTAAGVALALMGRPPANPHRLEQTRGVIWGGVAAGLGAALGQAAGSLIARPVMEAGMDAYLASLIRVGVATAGLTLMLPLRPEPPRTEPMTPRLWALTAATAAIGLLLGMTLLLYALQGGKVGIVSTLSATSPVLILPLLWMRTGQRPTATSWVGAILAVAGLALIFLR